MQVGSTMVPQGLAGDSVRTYADAAGDTDLLIACADFHVMATQYQAAERELRAVDDTEGDWLLQRCEEELWPAYFAKLEAIIAMPARTPEGLRAKAGVLRVALAATIGAQNDAARAVQWEPHERLAWSLVQDLTAER